MTQLKVWVSEYLVTWHFSLIAQLDWEHGFVNSYTQKLKSHLDEMYEQIDSRF